MYWLNNVTQNEVDQIAKTSLKHNFTIGTHFHWSSFADQPNEQNIEETTKCEANFGIDVDE